MTNAGYFTDWIVLARDRESTTAQSQEYAAAIDAWLTEQGYHPQQYEVIPGTAVLVFPYLKGARLFNLYYLGPVSYEDASSSGDQSTPTRVYTGQWEASHFGSGHYTP